MAQGGWESEKCPECRARLCAAARRWIRTRSAGRPRSGPGPAPTGRARRASARPKGGDGLPEDGVACRRAGGDWVNCGGFRGGEGWGGLRGEGGRRRPHLLSSCRSPLPSFSLLRSLLLFCLFSFSFLVFSPLPAPPSSLSSSTAPSLSAILYLRMPTRKPDGR